MSHYRSEWQDGVRSNILLSDASRSPWAPQASPIASPANDASPGAPRTDGLVSHLVDRLGPTERAALAWLPDDGEPRSHPGGRLVSALIRLRDFELCRRRLDLRGGAARWWLTPLGQRVRRSLGESAQAPQQPD